MTIAHLLEDFGSKGTQSISMTGLTEIELEEQRLASFENGYSAGWEDAARIRSEERANISAEMAQSLQDLSFTYQEAYHQMMGSVAPVLQAITHQILPEMAHHSLATAVVDELQALLPDEGNLPVEIVTAPSEIEAVTALLPQDLPMPLRVTEDANLTSGQAFMRIGSEEREINFDALLVNITGAIDAFAFQARKELLHG